MRARRAIGGLGVFLGLQAGLALLPDWLPFSVRPLSVAAPALLERVPEAGSEPDAVDISPAPEVVLLSQRTGAPQINAVGVETANTLLAPIFEVVQGQITPPPGLITISEAATGEEPGPVVLAFTGDVHFETFIRSRLQNEGPSMLSGLAELTAGADFTMVNLETAVTDRGEPAAKEFLFRAPASALPALIEAGVDAVSLANNHGMDFGQTGLEDTLVAAAEASLPLLGAGRSEAEAYAPGIFDVKGQRIAVIAATQVLDEHLIEPWSAVGDRPGLASAKRAERLVQEVVSATGIADTVVVFLHWGTEGMVCPTERQKVLADQLVAAGADVVVGSHAHRLIGAGRKNGAVVAYGLGNTVFYTSGGPGTQTGALFVTVDRGTVLDYRWAPGQIVGGVATPLSAAAAQSAVAEFSALRSCTDLDR